MAVFEQVDTSGIRSPWALDRPYSLAHLEGHVSLHRRDRFGVQRYGHYFSVDTGKYSTAPRLAEALAREIAGS